MACYGDLSIDEALTDPLIRLVMAADHVEPRALEITMRSAANRIRQNSFRAPQTISTAWETLIDCCHVWAQPHASHPASAATRAREACGAPCAW